MSAKSIQTTMSNRDDPLIGNYGSSSTSDFVSLILDKIQKNSTT